MKHLKKFENKIELDVDYMKECFISLIDKDFAKTVYTVDGYTGIRIRIPMLQDSKTGVGNFFAVEDISINEYYDNAEQEFRILDEVKNSLEKFSLEYPNTKYSVNSRIVVLNELGLTRSIIIDFIL